MTSDAAAQLAAWIKCAEAAGTHVSLPMKDTLLRALDAPVKCVCNTTKCAAAALPAAVSTMRLQDLEPAQLECCARRLFLLGAPTHLQVLLLDLELAQYPDEALEARCQAAYAALFASASIARVARISLGTLEALASALSELSAALERGTAVEKVPSHLPLLRALRHVDVSGSRLPPTPGLLRRLVRAVQHHGGVEALRLGYFSITADDLPAATTAPAVSSLSLSGSTGPWTAAADAASSFGAALRAAFPALRDLCLWMVEASAPALCAIVGAVGPLSSLEIGAHSTSALDVDMAALLRPITGTLRSLRVHQQELTPTSAASLAAVIASPECRLTHLQVPTRDRVSLMRYIAALKGSRSLRQFSLGSGAGSIVEARATVSLIASLDDTRLRAVTTLPSHGAQVSETAAIPPASAEGEHAVFRGYDLSWSSPLQQAELAVFVPVLHSLRLLNFSLCELRDPGVKTLAAALHGAPHLTSLSLFRNDFTVASLPSLASTVTSGLPALRVLDLRGNTELGKAKDPLVVARSLASIVAVTPALELVDLSYCDLGALVIRAVVEKGVIARHVAVMGGAEGLVSLKCADLTYNKLDDKGTKEKRAAARAVIKLSRTDPRCGPADLGYNF